MGIMKQLSNFTVFFNMCIFVFTIIVSETFGVVKITINVGDIFIERNISLTAIIVSIVVIIILSALSGINIFGSGVNDSGTQAIIRVVSMVALYSVMSLFTISFFSPLEDFGTILYAILTIFYGLGFLENNSDGGTL